MTTTAQAPVPVADLTGAADGSLPRALNTELIRLSRTMQVIKTNVSSAGGVPWSTYQLLFHLIAGGPQRSSALAESACADPSTVSRQADVLVRLGLAERQADPADGRASLLVATPAGVAQQEAMWAARDQMISGALADWTAADLTTLTTLLGRLNTGLSAELPSIVAGLQRRAGAPGPTTDAPPTQLSKDDA